MIIIELYMLYACSLLQCLMAEMIGVTLLDLRAQMDLTYEQIARGLAAKASGQFLGAFFAGILHEVSTDP